MKFILDGIEANPENFLEVNYFFDLRDRKRAMLTPLEDVVTFFGEDRQRVLDFVDQYSRCQGMPVTIDFEDANNTQIDMYLDFSNTNYEVGSDFVNCEMIRRGSIKNFINVANGKSLAVVNWKLSDFTEIDYQIIPTSQALYFISLQIALISLQQEVAKSIQDIAEASADVQEATIPSVSLAGVPVINTPLIISSGIKLAARIAYAIFIFAMLINIISDILQLIFPPVRQFKLMKVRDMLVGACADIGYTFKSNLIDSLPDMAILPVPLKKKDPSWFQEVFFTNSLAFTEGYPTSRDTISTIGDLIDFVENTFNAETTVNNGVVRIENRPFYFQNAQSNLIGNFNVMPDETTTISYQDTIFKRRVVKYQVDVSDVNTLDDQQGSINEWNVSILTSPHPDIVTIKGYESVDIPMAKGARKTKLSFVENIAKNLAKAVDFFTGGNTEDLVKDRVNIMKLSDQYFNVTKLVYMKGNRLHPDQDFFIGTQAINDNYFTDLNPEKNQIKLTVGMPIGLGLDKILQIESNNYVNLGNKVIRINYISFNDDDRDAEMDFEERESINNIKTTLIS